MTVDIPFQRWARTGFPVILCAVAMLYLGVHAIGGNSGLKSWFAVTGKIIKVEQELAVTRAARERLERTVNLLRADSLDRDMLDEIARQALGLAHPDDVIILLDE